MDDHRGIAVLWTFTLYCGQKHQYLSQTLSGALRQYHEANPGLPFEIEHIESRLLDEKEVRSWARTRMPKFIRNQLEGIYQAVKSNASTNFKGGKA